MTHELQCEKHKKMSFEGCPVNICEDIAVNVPVSVYAHSEVCDVKFICMGHTIEKITADESKECSKFNIVQKLRIHIPLKFKAQCDVSEGLVSFDVHDCCVVEE